MTKTAYPFVPKSTASLSPGDFWSIPLSDGSYGCGLVLQLAPPGTPGVRVSFCGALLDWNGRTDPDPAILTNRTVLAQGYMHILAIKNHGQVLGNLASDDRPSPIIWRDGGQHILRGYDIIRKWTVADRGFFPVLEYWGWDTIKEKAEQLLLHR
ncbi:hypothetical protein [uncultured Sphingomonas sp.]|uniref:hypothetical protein n=1 Tax=uncultured Sphingomonas sp. TaxID=158754 RepID=UPI003749C617